MKTLIARVILGDGSNGIKSSCKRVEEITGIHVSVGGDENGGKGRERRGSENEREKKSPGRRVRWRKEDRGPSALVEPKL